MAIIRQAFQQTPVQRDGYRSYPRDLWETGAELDVGTIPEVDGAMLSLHAPFHSPAYFDDVYSWEQQIQIQGNDAVLLSQLLLTDIDIKIFSQSDAVYRLQKHISGLQGSGGLWICPHLPLESRSFCEMIPALVESTNDLEFSCLTCHAKVKVSAFPFSDVYIYIDTSKNLGPFAELLQTMDPHNNKHLRQCLSMRLARGLQA